MDAPAGHDQNADQIAYWNGAGGQRWADRQPVQDILLQPIADLLIDRASIRAGERVLDVGCGTGLLACEFAARGYDVTGADPAAAMLAVARARPGGDQVRWVQAGAADLDTAAGLDPGTGFDLIVMTGHVFQLLLEDRDVRAALRTLARHLAPGGRLAFETRNPAVREWQDWNPRDTRQRVEAAGITADVHYDIRAVAGELVTYETWFQFAGARDPVVVPDTLRFTGQAQVAAFLAEAGLAQVTWYGDWDGSPDGPASPEIVAVASGPSDQHRETAR